MKLKLIFGLVTVLILFSVASVDAQTNGVCCLEQNGFCSSHKSLENCESGGGESLGGSSCYNTNRETSHGQCILGACYFKLSGRCSFDVTASQCEKARGTFDANIRSIDECIDRYVVGNVGGAERSEGPTRRICTDDGRFLLEMDSSGNPLRVIKEFNTDVESCSISNGEIEEIKTSCDVDDEVIIRRIGIADINLRQSTDLSSLKAYGVKTRLSKNMLGFSETEDKTSRLDGESWCIVYATENGQDWKLYSKKEIIGKQKFAVGTPFELEANDVKDVFNKYSAGQRYFKYSCVRGKLETVEADSFREEVCFENWEDEYYMIGTDDQKWAMCAPNDGDQVKKLGNAIKNVKNNVYDFVKNAQVGSTSRRGRTPVFEDEKYNNYQAHLNGISKAKLVKNFDIDGKDCRPRYVLGGIFYENRLDHVNNGFKQNCGNCGEGKLNNCDSNECYRKGDCSFKSGRGLKGAVTGCAIGAVTAELLYLTGGSLGLHSGSSWGSVFASPANAAPGLQNTGAIPGFTPTPPAGLNPLYGPVPGVSSSPGFVGVGTNALGQAYQYTRTTAEILSTAAAIKSLAEAAAGDDKDKVDDSDKSLEGEEGEFARIG